MVTMDSLKFKFDDGSFAPVFTNDEANQGRFVSGTSLSHFASKMDTSDDFLMTSYSVSGLTSSRVLQDLGNKPIYGPYTLKVMKAIGYATKDNPTMSQLASIGI